tara:strand:+ start:586 stop:1431 length:846 start_codon:yes stop_codon:yes gene_type:complete
VIFSTSLFAQKTTTEFDKSIKSLNDLGRRVIDSETDEEKYSANKEHTSVLKGLISKDGSFDYNFESLKTISVLQANNLKIYNWAIPLTDGTFEFFAFLQIRKSKTEFDIIELIDKSDQIKSPENKVLTAKSWYGALYHKLIFNKKLGKKYYTLLGWDGNNNLTEKKIIDVINISNNGMIKFGAPIFKTKKKTKKRMIFEYSENVVMSLKYHEKLEKIVYDVLKPASSKLKGIYEYYGPSLEMFDALYIENKKWNYQNDIDIKLEPSIKDSYWKKPKQAIVR